MLLKLLLRGCVLTSWLVLAVGCEQAPPPTAPEREIAIPKPVPVLESIFPVQIPGNQASTLRLMGPSNADDGLFEIGDVVLVNGQPVEVAHFSPSELVVELSPLPKGTYWVAVERNGNSTEKRALQVLNSLPEIIAPDFLRVAENNVLEAAIAVNDFDGDPVRVFVKGLPPGARWDEANRTLRFKPDFIQGGTTSELVIRASENEAVVEKTLSLVVEDTIVPPWPEVVNSEDYGSYTRIRLRQTTDDYLDSPGFAGRDFTARVVVPNDASPTNLYPVRVYLHGLGGSAYSGGNGDVFRIYPHDPDNTYWWGYSENLPEGEPTSGRVFNYTQRRVLHLLEWVLKNYPGADPNKVYVIGGSMGGAGSGALGLLHARHFCYVHSTIGQMVAPNHRPYRMNRLSDFWGVPELGLEDETGISNWERYDLTRALRDEWEAQNQFIYTKHGKDDPTIHFGAVTQGSALTGLSFYDAIEAYKIGHYAVWDEGGHGSSDPILGGSWWESSWNRVTDPISYLRRNLAFPAFHQSSANRDPGDGTGNGKQIWNVTRGYSGTVSTAGDTGWTGDIAGSLNRFLRWDSTGIVDTHDFFEIPLFVVTGEGSEPPHEDYPSLKDYTDHLEPITVDVTLRRIQAFTTLPHEEVHWEWNGERGTVAADADGTITIPRLTLSDWPMPLRLARQPRPVE